MVALSPAAARVAPEDRLPAAIPAMWRALVRGYRAEPMLLSVSAGLALLAALPDALLALWFKLLGDGVLAGSRPVVTLACALLAGSVVLTWLLRIVSDRIQRRFRDRVTIALESQVAELLGSIPSIAHHERPELLDRLAILRDQVFVLDHMYMSLFSTAGWFLRLGVTLILLISIHPALALLGAFALPAVLVSAWRPGVERNAEEVGASAKRLARHAFETATGPLQAKEVRAAGLAPRLLRERRQAWERWYAGVSAARWTTALWYCLGWSLFGVGFVSAVVFVVYGISGSAGSVLLLLAAGGRLSGYVAATVGEIGFLRGIWLDGSRRLAWLEDYAKAETQSADLPVPERLERAIRFEGVGFRYPGTERQVLEDVDLTFEPGSVVAIVGENGAGKTTLIKLLCRLYEPTYGHIEVDGQSLARMPAAVWRERISGAFQDFFRFEYPARQSIGVGDLPRMDCDEVVRAAADRAGAGELLQGLPQGMETQLGPAWPGGVEVSFGQWQKLALARGFMRRAPLLMILDEPTAALDAETEHALFERYAVAARERGAEGCITLLVSHRFSTVSMADQIVVLDGARVVEHGSHRELLRQGGQYASLYTLQANAYHAS